MSNTRDNVQQSSGAMLFTEEQAEAITARGQNLMLSAAAGSGKTTVLVERVLSLIKDDGADISRMLIVTFTRAAASEMKAKLAARLASSGDQRCYSQLMHLDSAQVTTIHGFCADFLRSNFELASVDPAFRVLDSSEDRILIERALDKSLESAYGGALPGIDILDFGRGSGSVRSAIDSLMSFLMERPEPEEWLDYAYRMLDDPAAWLEELKFDAFHQIRIAKLNSEMARDIPSCPVHYYGALNQDIEEYNRLLAIDEYEPLRVAVNEFRQVVPRGRLTGVPEETMLEIKRLRSDAINMIKKIHFIDMPLLDSLSDCHKLLPQLKVLGKLALATMSIYEDMKAERSALSYSDLERLTYRALKDPEAAAIVSKNYTHVFVDEYQDTSDIQNALINKLVQDGNLFMVGDVKQSIYRFRLAEPSIFMDKYDRYSHGDGGRLLPLTRNFRSSRAIIDFVNIVFERTMTGGTAEIVYDSLARLNAGLDDKGSPVEIDLIDVPDARDSELSSAELEGAYIARRIRELMAEDVNLRYSDIAVLTRTRESAFSAILPQLTAAGIPAYAEGAAGYYGSIEISTAMSLIKLIVNPRSDVELIGALLSPAGQLNVDEIATIRSACRQGAFVDAARAYAGLDETDADMALRNPSLVSKLQSFFKLLDSWRLRSRATNLGYLVRSMIDESGIYSYVGALPGGSQRQANLDNLVSQAGAFDLNISGSLSEFLDNLEGLSLLGEGSAARVSGEGGDMVNLMTIHKSKGLEFKVVFGAILNRKYRSPRTGGGLMMHRDLGVGIDYYDPDLLTRRTTLGELAIDRRMSREDRAEEIRILYVLLTRARQRLILTGTASRLDIAALRWNAMGGVIAETAGSHLDIIMSAIYRARKDGIKPPANISIISASELDFLSENSCAPIVESSSSKSKATNNTNGELAKELSWRYPDSGACRRPLKLTVTGLVREIAGPQVVAPIIEAPAFMSEKEGVMTGIQRGQAYHRAMQLINIEKLGSLKRRALLASISDQLESACKSHLILPSQLEVLNIKKLAKFFDSEVGMRLRASSAIYKELPFNVLMQASEVLTDEELSMAPDGELLVQGTIDCCFIEDGQWVLIDYKTDSSDDIDDLIRRYGNQLKIYSLALERSTNMKVKEQLLCLLGAGITLSI